MTTPSTPPTTDAPILPDAGHLTLYVLAALLIVAAAVFGWPNRHSPSVALETFVVICLGGAVMLVAPASGQRAINAAKDILGSRK